MAFIDRALKVIGLERAHAAQEATVKAEQQINNLKSVDIEEMVKVLSNVVYPVSTSRESIPDHVNLFEMVKNMTIVNPDFNMELLATMDSLIMYNPDVSKAIDNLMLANTKHTIFFDEKAPDEEQKEMKRYLRRESKTWYQYSDGTNAMINDFIVQAGGYGCVSFEMVANRRLNGLESVFRVHPKNVIFHIDPETNKYIPLQRIPKNTLPRFRGEVLLGEYKRLNETGYRYYGMMRLGESPYAVPPFLAALTNLVIQKDMVSNLAAIIDKLGLLGFLTVLLNTPTKGQQETDTAFQARLSSELALNVAEMKKGLKQGMLATFDDGRGKPGQKRIEMQNTTTNVSGAEKLIDANDTYVIAGLKEDPAMMGRQFSTSETFGRVILAKMTTKLTNYQNLVATALTDIYTMALLLGGYKYFEIDSIEFEPVMLGDKEREENAYAKKVDTAIKLRNQNIIDQQTVANIAGYDEPVGEAPDPMELLGMDPDNPKAPVDPTAKDKKKPDNPTAQPDATDPKTTKNALNMARSYLRAYVPEFDYHCPSGCDHSTHSFSDEMTAREEQLYNQYMADIEKKYQRAVQKASKKVVDGLQRLQAGVPVEQIESQILLDIYSEFGVEFADKVGDAVRTHVQKVYKMFRSDTRPFGNTGVPKATFELLDFRVMEYYTMSDGLYLGKFITDNDTRKRISRWVFDKYVNNSIPIGRDSKGIELFKEEFGGVLGGESWKIRRVIDTTVNRLRNVGAVNYMKQAEYKSFTIISLNDNLGCDYCQALDGKEFSVELEHQKIEAMVRSDVESAGILNPFATSVDMTPSEIKAMAGKELQTIQGLGNPPYHPHCRCRSVIG